MPHPGRGGGQEVAALEVFIQLTRASEAIAAELQPALAQDGLTAGQLGVLEAITARGPMSLRELGHRLFRSAPNMTIVVDNLERAGLVRRSRSAEDRRVVLVETTVEGRSRFRRAYPHYRRVIARFVTALALPEQAQLASLCERLRAPPGPMGPIQRGDRPHRAASPPPGRARELLRVASADGKARASDLHRIGPAKTRRSRG
jgi:MarR family transcriptional regulator, 2-MHQ and catechol-resistance regulon repressor